jgi:hypothetical protein
MSSSIALLSMQLDRKTKSITDRKAPEKMWKNAGRAVWQAVKRVPRHSGTMCRFVPLAPQANISPCEARCHSARALMHAGLMDQRFSHILVEKEILESGQGNM